MNADDFRELPDTARREALILVALAAVSLLGDDEIAAIRAELADMRAVAALEWILEGVDR